jgi:hypothetical protein
MSEGFRCRQSFAQQLELFRDQFGQLTGHPGEVASWAGEAVDELFKAAA